MKRRELCDVLDICPAGCAEEEENIQWQKKAAAMIKNIISVRLTSRQKEIIMLYYYEGMKQKDIANKLGISESAVSHIKRRALRRLEYDLNLIRS